MTNSISNANRIRGGSPSCTWDVQDSTGKVVGWIEAEYESKDVHGNMGTMYSTYTYAVQGYEVNMLAPDGGIDRVFDASEYGEYGTARKALAAAKKFAREFTPSNGGSQ